MVIVTLYLTLAKVGQVNKTCLDHNVVHSIAVTAGVELLVDGNLISLKCHLVDPLCERGTIVACEANFLLSNFSSLASIWHTPASASSTFSPFPSSPSLATLSTAQKSVRRAFEPPQNEQTHRRRDFQSPTHPLFYQV